jgi:hypothetical protein
MIAGYSLVQLVIFVIVICAVIGIALVAIRQSGASIPQWAVSIFWIVVVALVAIFAIKVLMGVVP